MRLQGSDALLGLGSRFERYLRFPEPSSNSLLPDAPDFENSPFWSGSDPESGLGGWGNPDAHMQVQDGAFAGFKVAYPYPHVLHRRFNLQPWLNTSIGFHIIPTRMVNETFTRAEVARVVNSHVGDYRGFQQDVAALPVSTGLFHHSPSLLNLMSGHNVQGMHSSIHRIVGG